jgi:oligopeptide transport system substrate-binding protein
MQAICNLYGVEYGEGTPYATLRDAYLSINGYNLTEAQQLMKTACDELVAAGLYKAGDAIHIRIGYKKGALENADNQQVELMNKYINAAAEGSGFGTITLEPIGNIDDRYGAVPAGEYAIGYGAWGGAAFYPFRNFQVYCDNQQYELNEAACWDPSVETLTINVNGEDVTMTWYEWSGALIGTGKYTDADFETKLKITATMEEEFLKKYYRIPLAGSCICEMLAYQCSYYTEDYNIMYGFGGIQLMKYNYSDAQWAEYVQSQGGTLSYE